MNEYRINDEVIRAEYLDICAKYPEWNEYKIREMLMLWANNAHVLEFGVEPSSEIQMEYFYVVKRCLPTIGRRITVSKKESNNIPGWTVFLVAIGVWIMFNGITSLVPTLRALNSWNEAMRAIQHSGASGGSSSGSILYIFLFVYVSMIAIGIILIAVGTFMILRKYTPRKVSTIPYRPNRMLYVAFCVGFEITIFQVVLFSGVITSQYSISNYSSFFVGFFYYAAYYIFCATITILIYYDAKKIRAGRVISKERYLDSTTWNLTSWTLLGFLLWWIFLPVYLVKRKQIFEDFE